MTQHLPEIPPAILGIRCNGCGTREEVALPQPVEDLDAEARYLATRLAREGWDIDPDNPGRPTRCALCVATGIKVAPVAALAMRGPHGGGYRGGAPASEVGPPRSVPSETIRIPVPAPTVSPLWADRIAAELARHHLDKASASRMSGLACTCGATVDDEKGSWQADGLDRHRAEAVVAALTQ